MKAVRGHEVGGPEVLRYEDVADLTPGPGQALVDIRSIGGPTIPTFPAGREPTRRPTCPGRRGREAAGVVRAVGEGVTEVAAGDRVAYAMWTGSYAEEAVVPSWLLVPLPDDVEFATGAATMLQAMTAPFP